MIIATESAHSGMFVHVFVLFRKEISEEKKLSLYPYLMQTFEQ
jgi:hypothetical protein